MIYTVLTIRPAIINIRISLTISFLLPRGHRDNKTTLAIFFLRFELDNVIWANSLNLRIIHETSFFINETRFIY